MRARRCWIRGAHVDHLLHGTLGTTWQEVGALLVSVQGCYWFRVDTVGTGNSDHCLPTVGTYGYVIVLEHSGMTC